LRPVTYDIPTYRFRGCRVFTNKPPCGPKRGHGTTQPRYAFECQLDKIATELGLDPIEFRLRITPKETISPWPDARPSLA
jgi:CO/xanthine dehydrogenase Mo-binding subunit